MSFSTSGLLAWLLARSRARALVLCVLLPVACSSTPARPVDGGGADAASDARADAGPDVAGDGREDGQDGPAPAGVRGRLAPPGAGPIPFELMPFPSDARLGSAGTIELPSLPGASAGSDAEPNVLSSLREMKGFGVTTGVFFPFEAAVDPASLSEAEVRLLDLEADPPAAVPLRLATRDDGDLHLVVAVPAPGQILLPGRRYAALVTTGARGQDGLPLAAPAGLRAILEGTDLEKAGLPADILDGLRRVQPTLEPLVRALPALKLDAGDLASATVFTTQDPTAELRQLREQVRGTPAPVATVAPRPEPGQSGLAIYSGEELKTYFGYRQPDGHVKYLIQGTFPSPWFLANGATDPAFQVLLPGLIQRAGDGSFLVQTTAAVPFGLILPDCPGESGCRYDALPLVVLQAADRCTSLRQGPFFARRGMAMIATDPLFAASRSKGGDAMNCFTSAPTPDGIGESGDVLVAQILRSTTPELVGNPRAVGDGIRQGALDLAQLARLLQNPSGLAALRTAVPELADLNLLADRLGLIGVSFATDNPVLVAAIEPAFGAVALQTGGGLFTQVLTLGFDYVSFTQPTLEALYNLPADDAVPGHPDPGRRPEFNPLLHLVQQGFEQGDLLAYAGLLRDRPGPDGAAGVHLFQFAARHDQAVPDLAQESLGKALGLPFLASSHHRFGPAHAELVEEALPPAGLTGNQGSLTRGFLQFEPAAHLMMTVRNGIRNFAADAEFPPFDGQLDSVQAVGNPYFQLNQQLVTFFDTYFREGTPRLIEPHVEFDEVVAEIGDDFQRNYLLNRTEEVPIGSYVTDALRSRYGTQLAFINAGAMVAAWPDYYQPGDAALRRIPQAGDLGFAAGPPYDLVVGDLHHSMPFLETAVLRQLTGAQVHELLELGLSALPSADRRFVHLSGLRVSYSVGAPVGERLVSVELDDGTPLLPDDTVYSVACDDFLCTGNGSFRDLAFLSDGSGQRREPLVEVVAAVLRAGAPVVAPPAGRIVQLP